MFQFVDVINVEIAKLEQQRIKYQKVHTKLKSYAIYHLHSSKRKRGTTYYYIRKKGQEQRKYLGTRDKATVRSIQLYRSCGAMIARLDNNIQALSDCSKKLESISLDDALLDIPRVYRNTDLLAEAVRSQTAQEWKAAAEAYKATFAPYRPDGLNHRTADGTLVRSKSEMILANEFNARGIAYVYECPLRINGIELHPDFTLFSERLGIIIIWEHFGRMFDPEYLKTHTYKMSVYIANGYIPNVNLITTYEDSKGNIDGQAIRRILDNWF